MYWEGSFVDRSKSILLAGPAGVIEALAMAPAASVLIEGYVAVVCHPHPLHGGSMGNKVVTTTMRAFRDVGIPAVCFNFRGVGASGGEFDSAVGEVDDLHVVVSWLLKCYPGAKLLLAGFSFGSSVAAQYSSRVEGVIEGLILIAPPVERYNYDKNKSFPCRSLVLIGDEDELVDVENVRSWQESLISSSEFVLFAGASHFFHGKLVDLKSKMVERLQAWVAA
jgi:alpha/beta superfamily hydrolase